MEKDTIDGSLCMPCILPFTAIPRLDSSFFLPSIDFAITVENLKTVLIRVISTILLLLSTSSSKKTGVNSTKYTASAFGLFAINEFLELMIEKSTIPTIL